MIEIVEYEAKGDKNYYKKWFKSLPTAHARKVINTIRRMEAGNLLVTTKALSAGVTAMRTVDGTDYKLLISSLLKNPSQTV